MGCMTEPRRRVRNRSQNHIHRTERNSRSSVRKNSLSRYRNRTIGVTKPCGYSPERSTSGRTMPSESHRNFQRRGIRRFDSCR
jgi:hypothetical protein